MSKVKSKDYKIMMASFLLYSGYVGFVLFGLLFIANLITFSFVALITNAIQLFIMTCAMIIYTDYLRIRKLQK